MNQTINVSIPKTLTDLAKKQVEAGYYASVSEVVRTALRELFFQEKRIPTFKMSKKAEKIALQARKDHESGKSILFKDIHELL